MKSINACSVVSFLLYLNTVTAQNEYYDAFRLRKDLENNRFFAEGATILFRYFKVDEKDNRIDSIKALNDSIKLNPFLKDYSVSSGGVRSAGADVKKLIGSIRGMDVTTIANGIAMFMIERAKQELTIAFFDRFKKFAEKNMEFQVLFPKTTDNLNNLLSYRYPEMLPALRTGFFEDLKAITYHLDDVLELPRYKELLKNFPEIRVAIRSIRLIHELESGESHPADIITKFAAFGEWIEPGTSKDFLNFGSSIRLAAIFSNSLRYISQSEIRVVEGMALTDEPKKAWISFKDLQLLIKDAVTFKIYLGLIYEDSKKQNIVWTTNSRQIAFTDVMKNQLDNIFLFENKITEFIELAEKVEKTIDTLKSKRTNNIEITKDDYYSYINTSIDVIEYGFSIAQIFNEDLEISEYTKLARKSNDLYRHCYKQEYTQAVTNAMDILSGINEILKKNKENLLQAVNTRYKIKLETDGGDISKIDSVFKRSNSLTLEDTILLNKSRALIPSDPLIDKLGEFIAKATKYGLFMANMVDAKSPEQVQSIMENAVLPVGSSSIKKNSIWNLSIQSYLGAYIRIGSLKHYTNSTWGNKFGVFAPIGIVAAAA